MLKYSNAASPATINRKEAIPVTDDPNFRFRKEAKSVLNQIRKMTIRTNRNAPPKPYAG